MIKDKFTLVTLKYPSDFSFLRQHGKRIILNPWFLFYFCPNRKGYMRYAWTIPATLGRAFVRNRLKRLIRSGIRETWKVFDFSWDVHFVFRPRGKDFYRKMKYGDFTQLLEQAREKIQKLERKVI